MRDTVNVIHCCPEGLPERVFRELARASSDGSDARPILREEGWIAVYGPFLSDDGTYKSPSDEEVPNFRPFNGRWKLTTGQFDRTYIKAKDDRLGLRSVASITAFAERWGFREVERKEMPKGNMWVVWQRVARAGDA